MKVSRKNSRLLFAREFLKHPVLLGSALPSSRFLVQRLLRQVDWRNTRVLVEDGPVVGTFTAEILKRLRPDGHVIAIEASEEFVTHLRDAHPDPRLIVVHGSAADVRRILRERHLGPADVIVSGIPFSTLAAAERDYERQKELYAAHAAAQRDFEAAEATFRKAKSERKRPRSSFHASA